MTDGDTDETEATATGPDDFTRSSRFVVIFHGDGPFCQVAEGWAAMLRLVTESMWDGDDLPDYLEELKGEIGDVDQWGRDDDGPFHFTADLGEISLAIYRIQDRRRGR